MLTSPWLSLAGLCCSRKWSPSEPNILCVGRWLPEFRIVSSISILGFGSLRSVCGFGTHALVRSRERSGYLHTTCRGTIFRDGVSSRVVKSSIELQSQLMKRGTGSFDTSLFLLPSNSFISCVSSSCPTGIPIDSRSVRCRALLQWHKLAEVAVFAAFCVCSERRPLEVYAEWEMQLASAVQCLANSVDGATPPLGVQVHSFKLTPLSICSVISHSSFSVDLASACAAPSGSSLLQDWLPPPCSEAHTVLTASQGAELMPRGIGQICHPAGQQDSIDLASSCVVNGCPLGRHPIMSDSLLASVASQCSMCHWKLDFVRGNWPCSLALWKPHCEPPTPSWLASSPSVRSPPLFYCHNHEGVKAEQDMHRLACTLSLTSPDSMSSAAASAKRLGSSNFLFCKTGSFQSLLATLRECSWAKSAEEEHVTALTHLASSVRSSFHKQILQAAKPHMLSQQLDVTGEMQDDDGASSCSFASLSSLA